MPLPHYTMPLPKVLINTLICIENNLLVYPDGLQERIIIGNIYEHRDIANFLVDRPEDLIEIWYQNKYLGWFHRDHFITIEEWRNKQIEEILK